MTEIEKEIEKTYLEKVRERAEQKISEYYEKLQADKDQAKKEVAEAKKNLKNKLFNLLTIESAINWTEMRSMNEEGEDHPFWQEAEKEIEEEEE